MFNQSLLEVKNLRKYFVSRKSFFGKTKVVRAVEDVSFSLRRGETFGLVGESGCGKSTLARTLLQLYRPTSGEVILSGINLCKLRQKELLAYKRQMQMVFQDSYSCFNPRMTVKELLSEPFIIYKIKPWYDVQTRIKKLLDLVGLGVESLDQYIHEFSGGQRQRIGIARALALKPQLVVADEPVSSLDVSIQSQILNLLVDLKEQFGLSYIFISHDLAVVEHISDIVGVMYMGRLVEIASRQHLFKDPQHPYTRLLLDSIPKFEAVKSKKSKRLQGDIPNLLQLPSGCCFHPRCPLATERCRRQVPNMRHLATSNNRHMVACHHI